MTDEKTDLLEIIARTAGCVYLSDLRQKNAREGIISALDNICADSYSLNMWEEAFMYIAGGRAQNPATCEQIKSALTETLEKKE